MKVFVYGTLKSTEINHHIMKLAKGKFLTEAKTIDTFIIKDSGYGFPYLFECKDGEGEIIYGELYEVPDASIGILDVFEDVPHLYNKKDVTLNSGESAKIYVTTPSLRTL